MPISASFSFSFEEKPAIWRPDWPDATIIKSAMDDWPRRSMTSMSSALLSSRVFSISFLSLVESRKLSVFFAVARVSAPLLTG